MSRILWNMKTLVVEFSIRSKGKPVQHKRNDIRDYNVL